jgi:hypothetical protein
LKAILKVLVFRVATFLAILALSTFAFGQTLAGTVKNGTTGKPAANDDVVLIKLAQGMEEAGRTKTDAQGKFSFHLEDAGGPHLIRVIHQGVTYHHMAPPGTDSVEAEVFDVAKKLEGLSVAADVMWVQTSQGQVGVSRLFEVDNNSQPPRTQMNDQNLEFYLPDGAQIDQTQAQTAGGQWVESAAVPQKEKGRYAFIFPLRPGATQFQVSYHLPYSGSATIDPRPLYPMQHFVVVLPQTIQFSSSTPGLYKDEKPPDPGATAEVAVNVHPGQSLAFSITGNGVLQSQNSAGGDGGGGSDGGGAPSQAADSRPGGGLGPPIEAPDPLEKYRWPILGGFALVLAAGAIYMAKRPQAARIPDFAPPDMVAPDAPRAAQTPLSAQPSMLLQALKEELFELEMEHQQGRISQQEYETAKAALDQTLGRALKRAKS